MKKRLGQITNVYILLMLTFFLFVFHDYYYDIQDTKFQWFLILSIGYIVICSIVLLIYGFTHVEDIKKSFTWKHISRLDIFMLLLFIFAYISMKNSVDYQASFDNPDGRHIGFLFFMVVIGVYVYISRFFSEWKYLIPLFLLANMLVAALGVLNFFDIDPFGFYKGLSDYQSSFYLSTIGNTNYIGSLLSLTIPFSILGFCYSENRKEDIFYGISIIAEAALLLCANADSGYLGTIVFLAAFLFVALSDCKITKRLMISILIMLITIRVIGFVSILVPEHCRAFFTVSYYVGVHEIGDWVLLLFGVLTYIVYVCDDEKRNWNTRYLRIALLSLLVLAVVIVIFGFYYFSVVNIESDIGILPTYLRFDDAWGTGRGFIWKKSIEAFSILPFQQQLFGYGLDTTTMLLYNTFFDESLFVWDAAHNEYIQYLIGGGYAFLITYATIILHTQYRTWKRLDKKDIAIVGAVLAYSLQAVVNIAQPITTPLLFIFIAILEAKRKNIERTERNEKEILGKTE